MLWRKLKLDNEESMSAQKELEILENEELLSVKDIGCGIAILGTIVFLLVLVGILFG
jgi:hypothetical protein